MILDLTRGVEEWEIPIGRAHLFHLLLVSYGLNYAGYEGVELALLDGAPPKSLAIEKLD